MALVASPLPCSEVAGVVQRQSCAAWTSPRAGLCWATKSCLASNQLVGSKADRRVAATNQAAERCAGDKRHCSGIWKANVAVKKNQWQQQSRLGVEVDIALMRRWRSESSWFESNTFFVLCGLLGNRALMAAASWLGQSNGSVPRTSTPGI